MNWAVTFGSAFAMAIIAVVCVSYWLIYRKAGYRKLAWAAAAVPALCGTFVLIKDTIFYQNIKFMLIGPPNPFDNPAFFDPAGAGDPIAMQHFQWFLSEAISALALPLLTFFPVLAIAFMRWPERHISQEVI